MTKDEVEKLAKGIYDLKLHEVTFVHDGSLFVQAIRVPMGWIYTFLDKGHQILSSNFVPFDNEFMTQEQIEAMDNNNEGEVR